MRGSRYLRVGLAVASLLVVGCRTERTVEPFRPDLTQVWESSAGDIHWSEGWYGEPGKILEIANQQWDGLDGVYLVEGRWGRTDGSDRGGFRFFFESPCRFTGVWWHASSPASRPSWKGELPGCE